MIAVARNEPPKNKLGTVPVFAKREWGCPFPKSGSYSSAAPKSKSGRWRILMAALAASLVQGGFTLGGESAPSSSSASPPATAWARQASLEQFLDKALRNHPEIVAAETQVQSAEAELRRVRFQVARELVALWNDWKVAEQTALEARRLYKSAAISRSELIQVEAKMTTIESQLPYLLGEAGGTGSRKASAARGEEPGELPQGPEVERIAAQLEDLTHFEFFDTPLCDVVGTISDMHQMRFIVDPAVADIEVSIELKGVSLGAGLQAVEDVAREVRFVVRDYGILVVPDDSEAAAKYVSANEFWRQHQSEPKTPGSRKTALPQEKK